MAIAIPLPIAKGGTGQAATGDQAFAAGNGSFANFEGACAVGLNNTIAAEFGTAIGVQNSTQEFAQAVGYQNTAGGSASAFGHINSSSGEFSSAVGHSNNSSSEITSSFGAFNWAFGTRSNAFGYGCYGGGASSSAFGYFTKTNVANTAEFGYWPSASSRGGAIRTDSSGMAALTTATGATALADGGATAGSEAAGTLPRGAVAFRANGDDVFVDYNNAGVIKTGAITPCRGQCSRTTSGTVGSITQNVYKSTGLTATFDSGIAYGTTLGTTDAFGIKNTSGETRVVKVYASMDASSGNNDILGIKIAKNGTPIDETECRAKTPATDFAKLVTNWMVSLANNDEVSIFVANHSGATNITLLRGRVVVSSVD